MSTQHFLFSAWTWNPLVMPLGMAAVAIYIAVCGFTSRLGYMVAAAAVFVLALVSPLNALADGYLFSAHMIQHILLLLIVPALAILSLPRDLALTAWLQKLANPVVGWAAGVGAMWVWHAPALCNAAVTTAPVYALQTASLLVMGSLFWWQVMAPREDQRLIPLAGVSPPASRAACLASS